MVTKRDVPRDRDLVLPVFLALTELGGTGNNLAIFQRVVANLQLSPAILAVAHNDKGGSELAYRMRWARTYLKRCGIIDNIKSGVWMILPAYQQVTYVDCDMVMKYGHSNTPMDQIPAQFQKRPWSRVELVLMLGLYYRLPWSQCQQEPFEVQKLAREMGRSVVAVMAVLSQFASLDDTLIQRPQVGQVDDTVRTIWQEFVHHPWQLAQNQAYIREDLATANTTVYSEDIPIGYNQKRTVSQRVGQQFFRQAVLSNYGNRCCMTGIAIPTLLVASHIKPWKDSDDATEKANPQNGLCLNALHDKAFDAGLITVDNQYRIVISEVLKKDAHMDDVTKSFICAKEGETIQLPERGKPSKVFLTYHQDCVFLHA